MVGRELPNARPNGEDHRGERGNRWLLAMGKTHGLVDREWWRNWTVTMIVIHKALG